MKLDDFVTVKPFDRSEFSVMASLREAFYQTLSTHFFKAVGAWLLLYVVAVLFMHKAVSDLVSFLAMIAVSVAWYRFLAYGEEIPWIRLWKKELWFLLIMILVGLVMMLAMGVAVGGFILLYKLGFGDVFVWIGAALCGVILLWTMPYLSMYMGLVALGFSGHLNKVREIVHPMPMSLWGGYILLMVIQTMIVLVVTLLAGLIFKDIQGVEIIGTVLSYLFTGITVAFTSHLLYVRATFQNPEEEEMKTTP